MIKKLIVAVLVLLGLVAAASLINGTVYRVRKKSDRWRYIVIHHSGTESGSASEFDHYHRNVKGWDELAYHFVIGNGKGAPDGVIEVGSRWEKSKHGAHAGNLEMNDIGIGICLVGNFEQTYPTEKQLKSLRKLLRRLISKYEIPVSHIIGHRQVNMGKKQTKCPGRNFNLEEIKEDLERKE